MRLYYNIICTFEASNNTAKAEMKVKIMTAGETFWVGLKMNICRKSFIWCLHIFGEVLNCNRPIVISYPVFFPISPP